MVCYYGFYSNKMRGIRKKAGEDDSVPALMEPVLTSRAFRKNRDRLIRKIYPVEFPEGNPIQPGESRGPLALSEVPGSHENHIVYRGVGGYIKYLLKLDIQDDF